MHDQAAGVLRKFRIDATLKGDLDPLYEKNNWRGLLGWAGDVAMIAGAIWLTRLTPYAYPLTVLVIGSRQRALASLLHEAAHLTLARNRRLNRFIGEYLAGLLVFQDFEAYRQSHVQSHHRFLGDPVRDPDYRYYIESGLQRTEDRFSFFFGHVLRTLLLLNVPSYANYLVRHRVAALLRSRRGAIKLLSVHAILLTILTISTGPIGYLLFWLIPYLTAFQVIGWLSEVSEHFGLFGKETDELLMTRNRFPSWWERALIGMHGDNLHLTHHLLAAIPYWNLRAAHRILMQDERYARANFHTGGIVSRGQHPQSVMEQIFDSYRPTAAAPRTPNANV
ncbi:fatty acid desaturase [Burkholderia cepacia]|uniref:guanitoxin biosynthesis L-arginine gamma (S) hydroxylase n=1 Tax=Burkholderia cepacia TaxID=292 RepID=UPI000753D27F|nr:guanitoxin biosynthesis L-arginine gamma (S) hydroxylase [Burkholderia cepacia]KVA53008.1 fatty acid desaturase [Burkholderia cepacia]KVA61525.1 fatty acid desaturase [Burkholderia cepacia]KVA65011.1 fatty acid desaturase [Burkholderia cepacia]KVA87269.1 fatty acid desaturase [Burkholderia cepacia]KVA89414.1 fatty acid desaturase [Burkholderia cepacia]